MSGIPGSLHPRYAQLVAGFNVYRTAAVREAVSQPRVFTFLHGLVVESEAWVKAMGDAAVAFQVDPPLASALEKTDTALVESPLHGASFRARVQGVDLEGGVVWLARFERFGDYLERRQLSRVVPDHPMVLRMHGGAASANGRVADLSATALAADFDWAAVDGIQRGASVRVEAWGEDCAPDALCDFETDGRIYRVGQPERGACRVIVELLTYPALDTVLRHYVARRQREILSELVRE